MTRTEPQYRAAVHRERPELLIFTGVAGLLGNIAPIVFLTVATMVARHDFVADTISDLGRGPHKWIMDTGFYLGAGGLLALAIGAAHCHLGRRGWSMGLFCLAFLALVITLLGLWDNLVAQQQGNWTWHVWLTFALGPLYLAGPLLMAGGAARVSRGLAGAFVAAAILWIVFATVFKLAPDSSDGLYEKIAVAATLLWTVPLSILLWRRGRQSMARPSA